MASIAQRKRTIKLRHADKLGREFIRVGSSKDVETEFTIFFTINENWLEENIIWFSQSIPQTIGGEASIIELYDYFTSPFDQIAEAVFAPFLFEDDSHFIGIINENGDIQALPEQLPEQSPEELILPNG